MNAPIDTSAVAGATDAAFSPAHPLWPQLFPTALAPHHGLIAHKLTQAIAADIDLGTELNALLAEDGQWLYPCQDVHPLPSNRSQSAPVSLAELDADAQRLRQQLKQQKTLSHSYLVDAVLAELQHGRTLNSELFARFKKLTLLCAIALTRVNLAAEIREDSTIEAALRNVRLAADQRRDALLIFLSGLDMQAPLDTLITALAERDPGWANNKSLINQVDNLVLVLERLAALGIKQQRGGHGSHRPLERQRLEFTPLGLADDHYRITRLTSVNSHQGRRRLSDEEVEAARDQPVDRETLLITQRDPSTLSSPSADDEPARPVLMDWQARTQQSRSVALSMSLRGQMLPCDPGCANPRHIETLAKALSRPGKKTSAQLALLAMLVLGLDWDALTRLPVWSTLPGPFPQPGHVFKGRDEQYHRTGIWCHPTLFALQRCHEVANSRVHRRLSKLLPEVGFYLRLPLPEALRALVIDQRLLPCSHELIAQELHTLCRRYQLSLTVSQVMRYFSQWLKRHQVTEATSGLLRGKTAQQCAQLAYSHLDRAQVLIVWHDYLSQLALDVLHNPPSEASPLGSRLYPSPNLLRDLLARYQTYLTTTDITKLRRQQDPHYHNLLVRHTLLVLNLATGARPVTDMYDTQSSVDTLMGVIRLVDKEGRDCSAARLVPLAPQALRQWQILMDHLALLAKRREPALQQAATAAGQALDNQHPVLFWLEHTRDDPAGPQWQVRRITVQSMQDQFDSILPLPANWHRHALCSALILRQVPASMINALLGHEEMGQEWGHPYSGASLNELRQLAPVLGEWLDELGLTPLPGRGSA